MTKYDYDLITIGAGSGGVRTSRMSSGFGARVAVAEESRTGGTCVMRGCVPKKLMVYGAQFAEHIEDAEGYGWTIGKSTHDWNKMVANKNVELDRLEGIYQRILRDSGVEQIDGRGTVVDAHTVEIAGKKYTTERILVAVGSRPYMPDIPGIEHVITSNEALDLPERPKRIVIVGGGFIAVEFAGVFNALGSKVDIVIRAGNILRGFDEDIRDHLGEEMEQRGIAINRECVIRSIEKKDDGSLSVRMAGGSTLGGDCIDCDAVLYATGRVPNTEGLGLENAGVEMTDRGAITVNDQFQTSCPSIYALGDVIDRIQLTPVALGEGMVLANTLYNDNPMTMDYDNVASAVFSEPHVGTVGLTEEEARERGEIDVYASSFRPMKHTLTGRESRSMMKLIVERDSQKVVGCHMVGDDSPEIIQGFAVALKCGATKAQFDATVGIHPTAAEEFVTMRQKRPDHNE